MSGGGASAADRARHPAARGRGDHLVALARRLVTTVDVAGPHRAIAVAARAVRGRQGRTVPAFAAAFGVPERLVLDLEAGWVPPDDVPAPLVVLSGLAEVARSLGR